MPQVNNNDNSSNSDQKKSFERSLLLRYRDDFYRYPVCSPPLAFEPTKDMTILFARFIGARNTVILSTKDDFRDVLSAS